MNHSKSDSTTEQQGDKDVIGIDLSKGTSSNSLVVSRQEGVTMMARFQPDDCFVFMHDNEEVGKLSWGDGVLRFTGCAETSAIAFVSASMERMETMHELQQLVKHLVVREDVLIRNMNSTQREAVCEQLKEMGIPIPPEL